jgi:hypothetical protein
MHRTTHLGRWSGRTGWKHARCTETTAGRDRRAETRCSTAICRPCRPGSGPRELNVDTLPPRVSFRRGYSWTTGRSPNPGQQSSPRPDLAIISMLSRGHFISNLSHVRRYLRRRGGGIPTASPHQMAKWECLLWSSAGHRRGPHSLGHWLFFETVISD